VAAVEEGRGIYANVQSFIRFSFSSNVALMLLVLGGAVGSLLWGLRTDQGSLLLPLTALQILWINFLGDGPPALALALDSSKSVMLQPPRPPKAPLLSGLATRFVLGDGLLKGGMGLSLLLLLPALGVSTWVTASAVFCYEGVAKLLSMFPARRFNGDLRPNHWVIAATGTSIALQAACIFVRPLRDLLGLSVLSAVPLLVVVLALLSTYLLGELLLRLLCSPRRASSLTGLRT
jgi:Ca2+-transporting ATPase